MADLEFIAYHGWGFGHRCWNDWNELPAIKKHSFSAYDRGYFGNENSPAFSGRENYNILLTHSYGLHFCDDRILANSDLLVIFSGFLSFHPFAAQFKRRSKMVLSKMADRFKHHPGKVISDFYQKVYFPEDNERTVPESLNKELLLSDLRALGNDSIDPVRLKETGKICILHGAKDAIVPKMKGRQIYDLFRDRARYFEVSEAGHALPFTHRDQCWSFIKPEIE